MDFPEATTTSFGTYAPRSDYEQGREDALNNFPRESTRPWYRKGYDRGYAELLARPENQFRGRF